MNHRLHTTRHLEAVAKMPSIDPDSQRMIDTEKDTLRRRYASATTEGELWFASLHALEDFINSKGRFPSRLAQDAAEVHLAVWLAHEDTATRTRTTFQIVRLIPFFLTPDVLVDDWWIVIAELERFVRTERRCPSVAAADEQERSLAKWFAASGSRSRGQVEKMLALATIVDYIASQRQHLVDAA
ncbi:hypothetical protein [Pseudolysinimonas sp.]